MDTRGADAPVKRSLRGGLILGAAAVVAFGLVALVHDATRDRIAASERARRVAQFDAVLGDTHHDNDLLADVTYAHDPDLLGTTSRVPVYRARLAGQPVAAVLAPVAPDGYAGSIDLLVAIGADGKVLGVHVLRHHETPGLGDAIEERKSGWIRGFIGRSLADPPLERWKVRKDGGDFDQFTGATVTPRAIVRAVAACLAYFRQHSDELFAAPATMPT
jgi:electron transport complex protein RnfG